jgi:formamidopyrimidine-DNA glycosylase
MMYGSWQFGRPGMKLRKPERQVRLRLLTAEAEAVFFNGPIVEVLTQAEARRHPRLRALGPDVMKEDFDRETAWRRITSHGSREIGDAILDQTLVAGVGNIFKAEGLFLARMDPADPVETLSRDDLDRLWNVLIPQMLDAASRPGPILTLPAHLRRGRERNWVYWRSGRPCFRCEARISTFRQGEMRRITFFCPRCQKSGPGNTS